MGEEGFVGWGEVFFIVGGVVSVCHGYDVEVLWLVKLSHPDGSGLRNET